MTRLFTTYYAESRPERQAELIACLMFNATVFDCVCVLAEGVEKAGWGNVQWRNSCQRQTYRQVTEWAESAAADDDLIVIANGDIMLPAPGIVQMQSHLRPGTMFALSRYEAGQLFDRDTSQDVWAFRGPPPVVGNFHFGVQGCDNAFAWIVRGLGYAVLNPSRSIQTIHVHASQLRTKTNNRRSRIPPPYLFVKPAYLGESPIYQEKCETSKILRNASGLSSSTTAQSSA